MLAPDIATAVGYGDRPAAPQVCLISFRPLVKGALRGFASVEILSMGLEFFDCPVLVSHGRARVALPGKLRVDNTSKPRTDAAGKPLYAIVAKWRNRDVQRRFSDAVVAAIQRAHPGALDGDGAA
jgi:hypothetical protein